MRAARQEPHIRSGFRQSRAKSTADAASADHRDFHCQDPFVSAVAVGPERYMRRAILSPIRQPGNEAIRL
jgi:hypothetical protein